MTGGGELSRKILTIFVVALSSTAALADSGNSVYIDQTNADNSSVSITQSGSGNVVGDPNSLSNPSFVIDGNAMMITFTQDGMNNAIYGNIVGGDTTANITQTGNSNSTTLDFGSLGSNGGTLGININGDNNTTLLAVGKTGDASNYNYSLNITGANGGTGSSNAVTSSINSRNATTAIALTGSSNTVSTQQSGGSGHSINLNVIGSSNAIGITQDGLNANSAIVNITGSNTSTSVIQH